MSPQWPHTNTTKRFDTFTRFAKSNGSSFELKPPRPLTQTPTAHTQNLSWILIGQKFPLTASCEKWLFFSLSLSPARAPVASGTGAPLSLTDTVQIGPGTQECEGRAALAKKMYLWVCVAAGEGPGEEDYNNTHQKKHTTPFLSIYTLFAQLAECVDELQIDGGRLETWTQARLIRPLAVPTPVSSGVCVHVSACVCPGPLPSTHGNLHGPKTALWLAGQCKRESSAVPSHHLFLSFTPSFIPFICPAAIFQIQPLIKCLSSMPFVQVFAFPHSFTRPSYCFFPPFFLLLAFDLAGGIPPCIFHFKLIFFFFHPPFRFLNKGHIHCEATLWMSSMSWSREQSNRQPIPPSSVPHFLFDKTQHWDLDRMRTERPALLQKEYRTPLKSRPVSLLTKNYSCITFHPALFLSFWFLAGQPRWFIQRRLLGHGG